MLVLVVDPRFALVHDSVSIGLILLSVVTQDHRNTLLPTHFTLTLYYPLP